MKKSQLLILLVPLVIDSSPAMASALPFGNNISEFLNTNLINYGLNLFNLDLDNYLRSIKDFVFEQIADQLNLDNGASDFLFSVLNQQILASIQSKLGDFFGSLGFPDPGKISEEIPEIIIDTREEEIEEFTPLRKNEIQIASSERLLTQAFVQSRLSSEAQAQKQANIEVIAKLAEDSSQAAVSASGKNITQDVLKQVARQNSDQAMISQAIYSEITQLGLSQTLSVNELSKITQNMEEQKLKETVDAASNRVSMVEAITEFTSLF